MPYAFGRGSKGQACGQQPVPAAGVNAEAQGGGLLVFQYFLYLLIGLCQTLFAEGDELPGLFKFARKLVNIKLSVLKSGYNLFKLPDGFFVFYSFFCHDGWELMFVCGLSCGVLCHAGRLWDDSGICLFHNRMHRAFLQLRHNFVAAF